MWKWQAESDEDLDTEKAQAFVWIVIVSFASLYTLPQIAMGTVSLDAAGVV